MKNSLTHRLAVMAALLGLAIAACGGGSSSSDTTTARKRNAALNVGVVSLKKVTNIQSGRTDRIVLTEAGEIYAWGDTAASFPVPPLVAGATRFVDVSIGTNTFGAFDDQNNLYAWGWNSDNFFTRKPLLPEGATKWTDLWMSHDFALLQDDKNHLTVWGSSPSTTPPSLSAGATRWVKAVLSSYGSLLIDDKGKLATWNLRIDREVVSALTELQRTKTFIDTSPFDSDREGSVVLIDTDGTIREIRSGRSLPVNPPSLGNGGTKFVSTGVCAYGRVALDDAGNIYGWSTRSTDSYNLRNVPTPDNGGTKFVQVSMTIGCSASALDDAGNVYAWGRDQYGLNTIPADLSSRAMTMPISAGGNMAFGIEDNGTITEFSTSPGSIGTIDGDNFIAVANGHRHALALMNSGTVFGWGDNESGQLDIPGGLNNVVQVAAGFAYSEALLADGTVVEWGSHVGGKIVPMPEGLTGVKRLVSGFTHVLAIKANRTVVAWGDNKFGNADVPDSLTDVISVAASSSCDAALKSDGSILYWGACSLAQTSVDSVPHATSLAATADTFAAVKDDGSVTAWGEESYGETTIPADVAHVAAVVGGNGFFLSVDKTGFVRAWGDLESPALSIPSSFSGIDPSGEEWVPEEPSAEDADGGEPYVYTDEDTGYLADFILTLPPAQQKLLLDKLGVKQQEVTANPTVAVTALLEAPKAAVAAVVEQANAAAAAAAAPAASRSSAATLPPARDPVMSTGTTTTPGKAATLLGLKGASKITFTVPKKAGAACSVTKSVITAKATGTCTVTVRYTDAKKKKRTTTLTLLIG